MAGGDVMRARAATAARGRACGQRGFTLLELLITLSVTTIGLVGLLSLHLSIVRGNDGASRSAEAQQLAVNEIESLRSLTPTVLMATLATNLTVLPPILQRVRPVVGRAGMSFTVTTTVSPIPDLLVRLFKIRTVVSWTENGGVTGSNGGQLDHAVALELVRTRQEAP
jgi:prepilin-type N-terminal cleavage/methylation domain-containing protein